MRPQGQLDRTLTTLTIGVHQSVANRKRALLDTRTGEYEQQVHCPISGQAGNGWGFQDQKVRWELPFLYAPAQHRVPFPTPHFTYGIEMIGGTGELVIVHAHVVGWTVTDEGWFVGAKVRFASSAPNATAAVPFSAVAHLSFTGYAAAAEDEEFSL